MGTVNYGDFASSIRFALMSRITEDNRVDIVLDLFRGSRPALTRTIARVRRSDAASVMVRCRNHLERLGAHAVSHLAVPADGEPEFAPVAAFDWIFGAS